VCNPQYDQECSKCLDGYGLLDTALAIYTLNISAIGNLKKRCLNINESIPGFFYNVSDKTFKKCPTDCHKCASANTCEVCKNHIDPTIKYYIQNNNNQTPICA
jgi:hypothetical protein